MKATLVDDAGDARGDLDPLERVDGPGHLHGVVDRPRLDGHYVHRERCAGSSGCRARLLVPELPRTRPACKKQDTEPAVMRTQATRRDEEASFGTRPCAQVLVERPEAEGIAQIQVCLLHRELGRLPRHLRLELLVVRVVDFDGPGEALFVEDERLLGVLLGAGDGVVGGFEIGARSTKRSECHLDVGLDGASQELLIELRALYLGDALPAIGIAEPRVEDRPA